MDLRIVVADTLWKMKTDLAVSALEGLSKEFTGGRVGSWLRVILAWNANRDPTPNDLEALGLK